MTMEKMRLYHSRGQTIGEYVLLLGVISVALLTLQVYMKRGIQAVIKVSIDQLGNQEIRSNRTQRLETTNFTTDTTSSGVTHTRGLSGGGQDREIDTTINTESVSYTESEEQE